MRCSTAAALYNFILYTLCLHFIRCSTAATGPYAEAGACVKHKIKGVSCVLVVEREVACSRGVKESVEVERACMLYSVKHAGGRIAAFRRLVQRPLGLRWDVMRYNEEGAPLALTDLGHMRGEEAPQGDPDGWLTALRLSFAVSK